MVRFFSFFLMIRFDQTFHLMLFFFDFIGLPSVLPNYRVDICPSWWLKLTGFFLMTRLENLVLPDCRVDLKTPHDDKVIFSFLWDFPNSKVYLIFFPFQGHNHDSLLLSAQWFFFSILLDFFEDFPVTNKKYMCNCFEVRWHACILTWFEI